MPPSEIASAASVRERSEQIARGGVNASRVARLAALLWAAVSSAHAHEHTADPLTPGQLGAVSFQTSCKAQVKAELNRGVALLHSFWHDEANHAFEKVAAEDPECAMAYWGQAMAAFHLYSSTPSPADLAAGQQALAKGDSARETSARESAYLHALHLLYDGYQPTDDSGANARRYSDTMRTLSANYPQDLEAKAFYALALLASDAPGDVTLTNSRKAVAVLYPLFRQHPDHPGFAHYIIHACDHPQMAEQGLEAARRYAAIAPAAPHALHMPSHIFARLGLWQDDIRSNLASKAAAESTDGMHVGAENRLHAMEFLEYAYLQSGQYEEARAIFTEAQTIKSADGRYPDYYLTVEAKFAALLAIETRDWTMAASLEPVPEAHWYSEGQTLLAHAIAAGHLHDAQGGKAAAQRVDELVAKIRAIPAASSSANLRDEIHAWAAFSRGDTANAINLLRPIADTQAKVGKGEVELPAREMLADMLLLEGKPLEALNEYQRSLQIDPNRFNGLLGAAQAAEQAGRRALAAQYYRHLSENSPAASGAAQTVLTHARAVVN